VQTDDAAQGSERASDPQEGFGPNAYIDWAERLNGAGERSSAYGSGRMQARGVAAGTDAPLWEPIFVRAREAGMEPDTFFDAARRAEDYSFDPFDLEYNVALRQRDQPVEAFLYRRAGPRPGAQAFESMFEVLTVGVPVTRTADTRPAPGLRQQPCNPRQAIGIIDDGIAILHPRFRRACGGSRFRAAWFQTLTGSDEILFARDVDHELAQLATRSEQELYAARAARIYAPGTRHAMTRAGSHGTLMLDLAAGADPRTEPEMASAPIYAVQLPPQAFDDTSGRMLQPYVVQGFRWLIYHSLVLDRCERLVANLSLGVVAGPKDGTSFMERQLRREMDRVRSLGCDRRVDLVLAYGNAREDRLVARQPLGPGERAELGVLIQPDDLTPSYLEVQLTRGSATSDLGQLGVTLTAPDGQSFGGCLPPGPPALMPGRNGRAMAALYHRPAETPAEGPARRAVKTVAFAPTVRVFDGDPLCQSGRWILGLENLSAASMDVVVQVQRDDSPFPRRTGARQARLDAEGAHGWQPSSRCFTALTSEGPLTHAGTNSAWGTVPPPRVHAIGGALVRPGKLSAAEYSAEGADWSGLGPRAGAVSETARAPSGVLGAGTFAAGTLRLSGTSAAAATYTRHLLQALPVTQDASEPSRLGLRTVTDNPAIRRRP
jgi:hypothetical protein